MNRRNVVLVLDKVRASLVKIILALFVLFILLKNLCKCAINAQIPAVIRYLHTTTS